MSLLQETLDKIQKIDETAKKKSRERIDILLKPVGSLGVLENIAEQLSAITGEVIPDIKKKAVLCFAGDHGVCDEGVSAAPQVFTELMTPMIAAYRTGVGVLSRLAGADVFVYDVGMIPDLPADCDAVDKKIRRGTANMRKEPAMTREEAVKALEIGIEAANEAIEKGYKVLGTGEMGIGNTTPSTAIFAVLGDVDPEKITGVGANLSEDLTKNKAQVIRDAIALNQQDKNVNLKEEPLSLKQTAQKRPCRYLIKGRRPGNRGHDRRHARRRSQSCAGCGRRLYFDCIRSHRYCSETRGQGLSDLFTRF